MKYDSLCVIAQGTLIKKLKFLIPIILLLCHCQSIPRNLAGVTSSALLDTSDTRIAQRLKSRLAAHPGLSGFYPLATGTDALIARLAGANVAEKSIDIQYYIWHDDLVGKLMMMALLEAADRGVRVRLLLDDLNIGPLQESLLVLDSHPNIEIRMFNPFANRKWRIFEIFRFDQVNRRMHNKSFVVDNQIAIVGGRNIGNEYFMAGEETNLGDYDVWGAGPVASGISKSFDTYWNYELAVPISDLNTRTLKPIELPQMRQDFAKFREEVKQTPYAFALDESELRKKFHEANVQMFWAPAEVIADSPDKVEGHQDSATSDVLRTQVHLSRQAVSEMFFVAPYFIPGKRGMEFLNQQIQRGVKIIVLTNSLASNDVISVFPGYKRYRKDLIKMGVELYELKPKAALFKKSKGIGSSGSVSGLHAKVYVFDRKQIFIGSMNLDPRSLILNSEMGIVADSPELAKDFADPLYKSLKSVAYKVSMVEGTNELEWTGEEAGEKVIYTSDPEAGAWKKIKSLFYSILMPESML